MAHRVFGNRAAEAAEETREPVTFDLAGEEGIACRENVNGKLLLELVGKSDSPNASVQVEGVLAIFDIAIRTDDGEEPDLFTGKRWDRMQPLRHHTQAELDALDDLNDERADDNDAIRERNDAKRAAAGDEISDDADLNLEDELLPVVPGIDPTSSWGRLMRVLDDPNTRVNIEELAEISSWIVEQVVGRPTRKSGGSRPGVSGMNRSSRRAQRSRG